MVRALSVEDNCFFRESLKTSLQESLPSLVIEEAGNGEEALLRINGMPPDVMFVDMRLGGMTALSLPKK